MPGGQYCTAAQPAAGVRVLGLLDEHVHLAVVLSLLLRRVIVVLVRRERLGVGQPLRVVLVRVVGKQRPDRPGLGDLLVEAVHGRGARLGVERGAVRVRRVRVGAEVVVERLVLVEDHDQVLDRRRGAAAVERRGHGCRGVVTREGRCRRGGRAGGGGARCRASGEGHGRRDSEVGPQTPASAPGNWAKAHAQPPEFSGLHRPASLAGPPLGQCRNMAPAQNRFIAE